MNLFEFDLNLIPKVLAQTADTLLQPTFGPLPIGSGPSTTASVNLTASKTSVVVGEKFEVDIEINTGTFTINEYHLVIDYNPARIAVVDYLATQAGTQIEFTDSVFSIVDDQNEASPTGRITLVAKTPSGSALQVNRKVATIHFQAQSTGTTVVETVEGSTGTQLINQNGVAIASSSNDVTITTSTGSVPTEQPGSTDTPTTDNTDTPTTDTDTDQTPSQPTTDTPSLPDTSVTDGLVAMIPILAGAILISLGLLLTRGRKRFNK